MPDQALRMARWYGLELIPRLDRPPAWATRPEAPAGEPPVDLPAYAEFVRATATRYWGQIPAYVVWNEPNLSLEWADLPPDPEGYVELLKVAHQAIKEADPGALVVAAGLAPTTEQSPRAMDDLAFLEAMLDAGAAAWFDVLAVHPYGFGLPPEEDPKDHPLCFRRLERLWAEMRGRGVDRPLWATEAGWRARRDTKDHAAPWVTLEEQADYLLRAHDLAARSWPWLERLGGWSAWGGGNWEAATVTRCSWKRTAAGSGAPRWKPSRGTVPGPRRRLLPMGQHHRKPRWRLQTSSCAWVMCRLCIRTGATFPPAPVAGPWISTWTSTPAWRTGNSGWRRCRWTRPPTPSA